jgi:hypothetical protein
MYVAAEGNHIAKVSSSSLNEKKKHSFPAPINKTSCKEVLHACKEVLHACKEVLQ